MTKANKGHMRAKKIKAGRSTGPAVKKNAALSAKPIKLGKHTGKKKSKSRAQKRAAEPAKDSSPVKAEAPVQETTPAKTKTPAKTPAKAKSPGSGKPTPARMVASARRTPARRGRTPGTAGKRASAGAPEEPALPSGRTPTRPTRASTRGTVSVADVNEMILANKSTRGKSGSQSFGSKVKAALKSILPKWLMA
ncbi:unnamed protein product [Pedinophyceae sp. YPF-701]|nr:unnamed protein product [Pedinophyceae sp. YPF-701]